MPKESTVDIGLVLPDLLGTYGDSGNAEVLLRRLEWRGIAARVVEITVGQPIPQTMDIYVLGGGEDSAGELAARQLARPVGLASAASRGVPIFAVCAGMQILGQEFAGHDRARRQGLGLLDIRTTPSEKRAVGEVLVRPTAYPVDQPLTGFENHQGATVLGPAARPLGDVVSGVGNGDGNGTEGAVQDAIVATYLHGPVLARNPQLADFLLGRALATELAPLEVPEIADLRSQRVGKATPQRQPTAR